MNTIEFLILGTETDYKTIYIFIYLSVAGFTINIFIDFYIKKYIYI